MLLHIDFVNKFFSAGKTSFEEISVGEKTKLEEKKDSVILKWRMRCSIVKQVKPYIVLIEINYQKKSSVLSKAIDQSRSSIDSP